MKILIFGGTTEGRVLSEILREKGEEVTVCVATAYGKEEQARTGVETLVGPFSPAEKQRLLAASDLCIDATHPYAEHITASVREACKAAGTQYVRLYRERSEVKEAVTLENASSAAEYLADKSGNILLTTGTRELDAFSGLDPERLFPRVLPTHEALSKCEALHIPHRNIIAMQGPFPQELNEALIRRYAIRFLVTKDGGVSGGFPEKAAAARSCGIPLIVLRSPEESGLLMDEILSLIDGIHREFRTPADTESAELKGEEK